MKENIDEEWYCHHSHMNSPHLSTTIVMLYDFCYYYYIFLIPVNFSLKMKQQDVLSSSEFLFVLFIEGYSWYVSLFDVSLTTDNKLMQTEMPTKSKAIPLFRKEVSMRFMTLKTL